VTDSGKDLEPVLHRLWEQHRPDFESRLRTIGHALDRVEAGETDVREGVDAAHKLAGALGMYGIPRGSQLASELEAFLRSPEPGGVAGLRPTVAMLEADVAGGPRLAE
jgi:HPt (histidine-containing phosphotransfer) domain-containing protein